MEFGDSGLVVEELSVSYDKISAVESLSFQLSNETLVLFGPSGCGKTTILKAILGVTASGMRVEGTIRLNGKRIPHASGDIGMVFQGPVIPSWMTVYDLCRMGCNVRSLPSAAQDELITRMLARFGLAPFANRYPYELSGGEKQRAALAVTLLNNPQALLLDEPTTFIDGTARIAIWDFIEHHIRVLGIPIVLVSHDPQEAVWLGDRILVLGAQSRVLRDLPVRLAHPRGDHTTRDSRFWEIKDELLAVEA